MFSRWVEWEFKWREKFKWASKYIPRFKKFRHFNFIFLHCEC